MIKSDKEFMGRMEKIVAPFAAYGYIGVAPIESADLLRLVLLAAGVCAANDEVARLTNKIVNLSTEVRRDQMERAHGH